MSVMTVTTKVTHKYLMNKTKFDLTVMYLDLLKKLEQTKCDRDRFRNHLDNIIYQLGIDLRDGDFPIEQVLEKISK